MATVTGYVEEVQSSLSDIAFRRFTDAMFGYKKVRTFTMMDLRMENSLPIDHYKSLPMHTPYKSNIYM